MDTSASVRDLVREFGETATLELLERYAAMFRRDAAIRAALDAGQSYSVVASQYHLSVRQVIRVGKGTHR